MDLKNDSCSKIYDFYQGGKLCDLVLIAERDGTRISTHRLVVSAASEYFETMFTTSMKEKDMKEVPLGDVSGTMLKNLIEYCYTGQFNIDAENVNDALAATTMFRLVDLIAKCADYLEKNLSIESCLATWKAARMFDLHDVTSATINYFCDNLSAVVDTDGFLQLKAEQLIKIMNHHEIAVESEEDIFETIGKWIEFDPANRRNEFEIFLTTIRMSQLSDTFVLKNVLKYVKEIGINGLFMKVWEQAVKSKENASIESTRYKKKGIYAVSKDQGQNVITIQRYNQALNSWEIVYTLNKNLKHFDVFCNNNEIFLIGGAENDVATNQVRYLQLNVAKPVLTRIKQMKFKRQWSASTKMFDFIYVTGGATDDSHDVSRTVERLNLKTMEWTELPPMQKERRQHSIAALSGKLFVTGGFHNSVRINNVECFDPQLNSWTNVSPMNTARAGHRCVVVDNILYAIGGHGQIDGVLNSIEKYDEVADKWIMIETELSIRRCSFGAVVSRKWIFIGGGEKEGLSELPDFEKLNIETGERLILASLPQAGNFMHLVQDS